MQDTERTDASARLDNIGWWLFVLGLAAAAAFVAAHFVGMLVVGVFGYYATRPICDRIGTVVDSDRVAALVTVLTVLLPVIVLLLYLLVRVVQQVRPLLDGNAAGSLVGQVDAISSLPAAQREQLRTLLRDPTAVLGGGALQSNAELAVQVAQGVFGAVLLASLAVTLSYVLLARDSALSDAFAELVGGRDTTVYAYAAAVDEDLESVFFGNLLFAAIMAVIATATYGATNLVAPAGLHVPMALVLGFLTGVASLVPIVVGKLVYVPVVGYLALQAVRSGAGELTFVGLVLVVYLVVLDLAPQALVQPYVSGRHLDMMMLLFAYILGPLVFGWYGFFLLPILFVLVFEAVRIVLPELLRGAPPRPTAELDTDSGTDPQDERDDVPGPTAPRSASDEPPVSADSSQTGGDSAPGSR